MPSRTSTWAPPDLSYYPDYLVRLRNGLTVLLEIKGFEDDQDRAKHEAARRWVRAVNHWGQLGRWQLHVCYDPYLSGAEGDGVKAYVDESGDEGTGGHGSRWLVFACVVDTSAQGDLATFVDLAATKIQRHQAVKRLPHFQDLQHRDKKGLLGLYAQASWDGIVVASDTQQIRPGSPLGTPKRHYDYVLRHVLERASQHARQAGEDLTFILEARRNFDVADFRRYVTHLRATGRNGHMCWDTVAEERILAALPAQEPNLCVADAVAHAVFKALEPDREWGDYELAYAEQVRAHLWRGPGLQPQLLGHGLTFLPISLTAAFLAQYPWVTDWAGGR